MDKLYSEIGTRMRSVRTALKLTQAQVADQAGIDFSFYGQIERGKNIPSLKTLLAIARALNVEPAQLLPGKASNNPQDAALERIVKDLDPKGRKLVMGVVSDMVARLQPGKVE